MSCTQGKTAFCQLVARASATLPEAQRPRIMIGTESRELTANSLIQLMSAGNRRQSAPDEEPQDKIKARFALRLLQQAGIATPMHGENPDGLPRRWRGWARVWEVVNHSPTMHNAVVREAQQLRTAQDQQNAAVDAKAVQALTVQVDTLHRRMRQVALPITPDGDGTPVDDLDDFGFDNDDETTSSESTPATVAQFDDWVETGVDTDLETLDEWGTWGDQQDIMEEAPERDTGTLIEQLETSFNPYDPTSYDQTGFNGMGLNRRGFDRSGFNVTGRDEHGYNAQGFNSQGYNRAGVRYDALTTDNAHFSGYHPVGTASAAQDRYGAIGYQQDEHGAWRDTDGFDLDGYNTEGFDRAGFTRQGFDSDGNDPDGNAEFESDYRHTSEKRVEWDAQATKDGILLRCSHCGRFTGAAAHTCPSFGNEMKVVVYGNGLVVATEMKGQPATQRPATPIELTAPSAYQKVLLSLTAQRIALPPDSVRHLLVDTPHGVGMVVLSARNPTYTLANGVLGYMTTDQPDVVQPFTTRSVEDTAIASPRDHLNRDVWGYDPNGIDTEGYFRDGYDEFGLDRDGITRLGVRPEVVGGDHNPFGTKAGYLFDEAAQQQFYGGDFMRRQFEAYVVSKLGQRMRIKFSKVGSHEAYTNMRDLIVTDPAPFGTMANPVHNYIGAHTILAHEVGHLEYSTHACLMAAVGIQMTHKDRAAFPPLPPSVSAIDNYNRAVAVYNGQTLPPGTPPPIYAVTDMGNKKVLIVPPPHGIDEGRWDIQQWHNIIEDGRMEHRIGEEAPGLRQMQRAMARLLKRWEFTDDHTHVQARYQRQGYEPQTAANLADLEMLRGALLYEGLPAHGNPPERLAKLSPRARRIYDALAPVVYGVTHSTSSNNSDTLNVALYVTRHLEAEGLYYRVPAAPPKKIDWGKPSDAPAQMPAPSQPTQPNEGASSTTPPSNASPSSKSPSSESGLPQATPANGDGQGKEGNGENSADNRGGNPSESKESGQGQGNPASGNGSPQNTPASNAQGNSQGAPSGGSPSAQNGTGESGASSPSPSSSTSERDKGRGAGAGDKRLADAERDIPPMSDAEMGEFVTDLQEYLGTAIELEKLSPVLKDKLQKELVKPLRNAGIVEQRYMLTETRPVTVEVDASRGTISPTVLAQMQNLDRIALEQGRKLAREELAPLVPVETRSTVRRRKAGRIGTSSLVPAMSGSKNPYERIIITDDADERSVDASIVFDFSGSMEGFRAELYVAVRGLEEGLRLVGQKGARVTTDIRGFDHTSFVMKQRGDKSLDPQRAARILTAGGGGTIANPTCGLSIASLMGGKGAHRLQIVATDAQFMGDDENKLTEYLKTARAGVKDKKDVTITTLCIFFKDSKLSEHESNQLDRIFGKGVWLVMPKDTKDFAKVVAAKLAEVNQVAGKRSKHK